MLQSVDPRGDGWAGLIPVARWIWRWKEYFYAYGMALLAVGGTLTLFIRIFFRGRDYSFRRHGSKVVLVLALLPAAPALFAGLVLGFTWLVLIGVGLAMFLGYIVSGQWRRDELRGDFGTIIRDSVARR